jgi:hypothetical protein
MLYTPSHIYILSKKKIWKQSYTVFLEEKLAKNCIFNVEKASQKDFNNKNVILIINMILKIKIMSYYSLINNINHKAMCTKNDKCFTTLNLKQ